MIDESASISSKTWTRTVKNINKVGYSDGVSDGQSTTFQSSFDMGYKQGLSFGIDIGYKSAMRQQQIDKSMYESLPVDSQHINCQICLNGSLSTDNIVNLFNNQKERNDAYLRML